MIAAFMFPNQFRSKFKMFGLQTGCIDNFSVRIYLMKLMALSCMLEIHIYLLFLDLKKRGKFAYFKRFSDYIKIASIYPTTQLFFLHEQGF